MSYFESFLFGLTIAISIGPIAILILNQSINCGLRNGALCGLGAAFADLTYAITVLFAGKVVFSMLERQQQFIPPVSAAILVGFGIWMIYSTFRKSGDQKEGYSLTCRWPFATTYGLTISNPLTVILFAGFAGLSASKGGSAILNALAIFAGSFIVQMLIAFAGSRLAAFFTRPKTLLYFNLASAAGIMGFGISRLF